GSIAYTAHCRYSAPRTDRWTQTQSGRSRRPPATRRAEDWGGTQSNRPRPSLCRVIRSFARDHDVVHVAFAQAGGADAHESRLLLQFSHRLASAITHARPKPAYHLVDNHRHRTTIRHAPFNSLRHQLSQPVRV